MSEPSGDDGQTARSVWIVDDEPLIRAAVVAVLTEVGYEPRGFESAEGLYVALVEGARPDVLVLDHMLPDESGAQIVRSLREHDDYHDIPVIFITALSHDEADRLSDLAPVLRKPFDFRDLVAAVDEQLALSADRSTEGSALSDGSQD
jgi:DNA-binding response OmpR family regulator